ncbi:MAG: isopeptide-forming domain-containing fimbrial protein, partial [Tissierellia bacterium]|nr:isopeptide-forming domain-containing fimbrial protein [Tissierellia bacterium]
TKTSDLEGKIDLSGIVANTTYTLKEIKAPAGYQIDPTEYTIIVDADGVPKVQVGGADLGAPQFTVTPATETTPASYQLIVTDKKLSVEDPVKKINGEDSLNLSTLSQDFDYTVDVPVTSIEGMTSFIIEDTVHDLLDIVPGSGKVTADGVTVSTTENLTVEGKKITFSLTSGFDKIADRTVRLSFKAKIAAGVTMDQLKAFMEVPENNGGIPNTATLKINDNPQNSNTVYLVPGEAGEAPTLEKKVNGLDHYNLKASDEVFKYKISVKVPENVLGYNSLVIKDTLAKVLMIDGGITLRAVTYDSEDNSEETSQTLKIGTDYTMTNTTNANPKEAKDGEITATFVDGYDYTKLAGKTIVMEFNGKIKPGVTLEQLKAYTGMKVPNEAVLEHNKVAGVKSIVTITPPSEPTIEKKVNGEDAVTLNGTQLAAPITYTVEATVPFNTVGMTKFQVSDKISEILNVTTMSASVTPILDGEDGLALIGLIALENNNNLITATINDNENIAKFAGKTIKLSITATIDQTKDLSAYLIEGKLPNTAEIKINDKPSVNDDATITPALGKVSITKTLEGETATWPSGEKAVFKLEKQVGTEWILVKDVEITGFSPVEVTDLLPGKFKLTE